jgi:UDPglucose 6-dehydrogenase
MAKRRIERVKVIGSGVVGFATGRVLSELGHHVSFVDTNPERCQLIGEHGFDCQDTISLGDQSTIVFLSVPTPSTGKGHDLSAIIAASEAVGRAIGTSNGHHVVVTRSTVPPRTTEQVVAPAVERSSGKSAGDGFEVGSAPEFLREVSALDDARTPRMTVTAAHNADVRQRLADLFAPLGGEHYSFDDLSMAEMIKIVHNCFNAQKISFFNEIHAIASTIGIDGDQVASVVVRSAEAQYNEDYGTKGGYAFGGACLPKDLDGLIGFAHSIEVDVPLLEAVRVVNLFQLNAQGIEAPSIKKVPTQTAKSRESGARI